MPESASKNGAFFMVATGQPIPRWYLIGNPWTPWAKKGKNNLIAYNTKYRGVWICDSMVSRNIGGLSCLKMRGQKG